MAVKKIDFPVRIDPDGTWTTQPTLRADVQKYFGLSEQPLYITMSFVGRQKERTSDQNAYYWGVVVPIVTAGFIMQGNELRLGRESDKMLVHNLLKDKFAKDETINLWDSSGEVHTMSEKTTTSMSTVEFNKYLSDIVAFTRDCLGLDIPEPNCNMTVFDDAGFPKEISVKEFLFNIQMRYEHA